MIGGFLFVSGILLYTGIRIAVVLHMKEVTGWSIPPGRYGTALGTDRCEEGYCGFAGIMHVGDCVDVMGRGQKVD